MRLCEVGAGTAAVVVVDGYMLLMRRMGAHGSGTWAPPGGWMDYGETPEEAVVREVWEETGLRVTARRRLGITEDVFPERQVHSVCYFIECVPSGGAWGRAADATIREPDKADALKWVPLGHVVSQEMNGLLFAPLRQFVEQNPRFFGVPSGLPQYTYVASSWRCEMQATVVEALRAAGLDCYDFKHPEDGPGFRWTDVGLPRNEREGGCSPDVYLKGLEHPVAVAGYERDFAAMERADTFVLVLPCNRSAHLELGWAVGQGKRTAILLEDPCEPELMYRMVDYLTPSVPDLLGWLGVDD